MNDWTISADNDELRMYNVREENSIKIHEVITKKCKSFDYITKICIISDQLCLEELIETTICDN